VITIVKTMIVNKNEEQRLITLPLLIPNYDDCDAPHGEKQLSIEQIADFSHKYMEKYRKVDGGHTYIKTKKEVAVPVESWQLRKDTAMKTIEGDEVTYPKGTWMGTLKVFDDDAWDKVDKGIYTGGSVTVLEEAVADEIVLKEAAEKGRVLIKDIPNPAVATIALVEKPCVFGAKFCSVKAATKSNNKESFEAKRDKIAGAIRKKFGDENHIQLTYDDKVLVHNWKEEKYYEIPYSIGLDDTIEFGEPVEVEQEFVAKKMLEVAKKAGRSISDSTFTKLKNAWDSLGKLIDKANNEREDNSLGLKSDKMTNDNEKNKDVVTKAELDTILDEKFEKQEDKLVEAVKAANETDEDKKKKKLDKIKKDLEDLGIDTSKIDFTVKKPENDEDEEVVSKKEYNEVVEKNKEYAEQLGIDVESQSLKGKDDDSNVSTKSEDDRIFASMNKTKKSMKNE
jgi:hypothetical protein